LDISSKNYQQLSKIPAKKAFHGGEDVAVYATGPMAHLFYGVHEQNYVAHVMGHAACMGPYAGNCKVPGRANGAVSLYSQQPIFVIGCVSFIVFPTAHLCYRMCVRYSKAQLFLMHYRIPSMARGN